MYCPIMPSEFVHYLVPGPVFNRRPGIARTRIAKVGIGNQLSDTFNEIVTL